MMEDWFNYFWQLFFRFLYLPNRAIEGDQIRYALIIIVAYYLWDKFKRNPDVDKEKLRGLVNFVPTEDSETSNKMSDTQIAIADTNAVCVGNKEVESESTEETTLTEVHKDLGHTKIVEKTAAFESNETTSLVEENKTKQTESSKSVVQSESVQISANRQDYGDMSEVYTGKEYLI